MIVEGINHLTHLLKAIEEEQGRFLVGVPEWVHYLVKATPWHVGIQPKKRTPKHVDGLGGPPRHVPVGNSIVVCHMKKMQPKKT